jgi:DNA-binding response OmpR family regulator
MLKVLVVEDDFLIADMAEQIFVLAGYEVCGIARTVTEAVALARSHKPDLAVVDLRLGDAQLGTELAAQLGPIGRPRILYTTGNSTQVTLTDIDGEACLVKPYTAPNLLRALEIVAEMAATGSASPPFPQGFHLLPSAVGAPRKIAHEDKLPHA